MAFSKEKAHDRAEKYAARGQHDRAAREYQSIVEHDPKDVRAWLMLADSLARTGDRAGAVSRYQQVGDFYASSREFQKALAVYRQVLNLDPSRLDIHYKCAQLNMEVGRVHDAIASFESIAQSQLQTGRVSEALQTYRTIADADPSVVSKRLRLAELYSREKMVDEAVEAFRHAAKILLDAGRHSDYVRVAERLVYHKPDDRETIRELARVYLHLGDARRALMKLNGLLQSDPGDATGLELLAETFMALGKPDKASSVVVELVKKLREGGDEAGATRALKMGLDWIPHDPELLALNGGTQVAAEPEPPRHPTPPTAFTPAAMDPVDPVDPVDPGGPPDSGIVALELDDSDVVELDDGDFELEGAEDEPPASTSMTDHVIEEVSQAGAAVLASGATEGVDPSTLTDTDKLLFEARVYVKYRLFEHALEHLDPLLDRHPEHVPALSLKARSLAELERLPEAAAIHAYVATLVEGGDPKLAREHVQAALQAVPRHPEALAVQSRLENGTPAPTNIVDFDEATAVAADALDMLDDDIAIDVADPDDIELDTQPIIVENRFGISEAGPLPEPDPGGNIALSIAPTEQMQALQRSRSPADKTPPTGFVPRDLTAEMDTGASPERQSTSVDIPASAADPMSDLLDIDDDSGAIDLDIAGPLSSESHEPTAAEAAAAAEERAEAAFDDSFDAAFDDGFDALIDADAPAPTEPAPLPAVEPAAAKPAAAKPADAPGPAEPPGGWPDLSDDLAEVRFYLDQGLDEDAGAALDDLLEDHPGHPELQKLRAELSGVQVPPPPAETSGAAPLVDLDEPVDESDEADEDAYLSAIFGGGDAPAKKTSPSAGASAKAQDVEGAAARDRFDLGMAYREMGLVDSAVAEFEAASTDPEWESRARVMLGTLRVLQGDTEQAVTDLKRAAEVASSDEERSSAAYELALVYEKTGDEAAAIELLEGVASGFRERDDKLAALRS